MDLPERLAERTGFQWDAGNSDKSWIKHGVSQAEAEQVFFNQPLILAVDKAHSQTEERLLVLGKTNAGRFLFEVFTVRGELIRIISARDMSESERRSFERT